MNEKSDIKAFTLVEIMVAVAIIIILAVILIPNVIRARIVANETAAIASCRVIANSCNLYLIRNDVYPDDLTYVVEPISNPPYLDSRIANANRPAEALDGYFYIYRTSSTFGFECEAFPFSDTTGKRYFYVNSNGVIHYNIGEKAGADDPTL